MTLWGKVCYTCVRKRQNKQNERGYKKAHKNLATLPDRLPKSVSNDLRKMADRYRETLPIINDDAISIRRIGKK